MAGLSEDELIARYLVPLAGPGGLGLADDAACIKPRAGHDLVLTVDAIVEGVHFLPDDPPETLGAKILGVNLSDLAAKAADPVGFLLTLALPGEWFEDWLARFTSGLGEAVRAWGCPLLGGDTVRAHGALSMSLTALGEVPTGAMVRRTTAQVGDHVVVSGTIGDAVLGLFVLTADRASREPGRHDPSVLLDEADRAHAIERYRRPMPRLSLVPALRRHASAAMDVSDGFVGDLSKMMRVSGTGARIDLGAVPLSRAGRRAVAADTAWHDRLVVGGDDYEILACVPDAKLGRFLDEGRAAGVALTVVGTVVAGSTMFLRDGAEKRFKRASFSHF